MKVETKRQTTTTIEVDGQPIDYSDSEQCKAVIEHLMLELETERAAVRIRAPYVRPTMPHPHDQPWIFKRDPSNLPRPLEIWCDTGVPT